MGELTAPLFCVAPITTVFCAPFTGTKPNTGEGGKPPPTKVEERVPPQPVDVPIAPEALNKFNQ